MTGPSTTPEARLRVGLLVGDAERLRRWQADVVRALLAVPGVEIPLAVVDARPARRRRSGRDRSTLLWDLFNNRWVARRARSLRTEPLAGLLPTCEILPAVVETRGKWSEHFDDADLELIRAHELDVMIRFGFGIIRGGILDAARLGVWSFHHDDDEVVRGGPPAFWEIVDGEPVTGTVLQRLTDRLDGGFVLHKGWFRTADTSYVRNTDTAHLGAVDWPARVGRAVLAGDEQAAVGVRSTSSAPIRRKPTNAQTARFLAGQGRRWTAAQARALTTADQWEIGLVRAPVHRFLDPGFVPAVEWLDLAGGRNSYAADPFPARLDGRDLVLYERFDQRRRTGEIWAHDLDTGTDRPAGLPVGAHASYPFTLTDGGELHCIPQVAGEPARLHTWCHDRWETGPVVGPDRPVLDATVFDHDGRWWLLATEPGEWSLTHLHAWWADELDGPWHAHLLNPVKTDVASARPGGTPFVHEGRLYRPTQDGSSAYGGALAIAEVTELTPDRFAEHVVRRLEPDPAWPFDRGVHTLSAAGAVTFLDAKRTRFNPAEGRAELAARLRKLRRRR